MQQPAITQAGDCYRISGDLVFGTVTGLLREADHLFIPGARVVFDYTEAGRTDSAGLALLLEWRERAVARNVVLQYRDLPASIRDIARLSNAEALLEGDS